LYETSYDVIIEDNAWPPENKN